MPPLLVNLDSFACLANKCLQLSNLLLINLFFFQSSLTQPQMLVVSDLDDIFLPLPDDLLVNLSESRHVVEAFLDSLPVMFQSSVNVESALGPALKASLMVMVNCLSSYWFLFVEFNVHLHVFPFSDRVNLEGSCSYFRVLCHLLVLAG